MNPLRQSDLVRQIWKETEGIPLETVRKVMRVATNIMVREVRAGRSISIRGLGLFDLYRRPARKFYNPATKGFVDKPETGVPRFRFSIRLKEVVMKTPLAALLAEQEA
jgi:nucleoid DNA-binding protein